MIKRSTRGAVITAILCILLIRTTTGYVVARTRTAFFRDDSQLLLYAQKKKRKLNMAEKRSRRSKRQGQRRDASHLPPPPSTAVVGRSSTPIRNRATDSTHTKAQQLLETQRESVAMLTNVKQAVDQLPVEEIQHNLSTKGYWYGDDFLQAPHILSQLQREGSDMLPKMTVDKLGTGEYVTALQGGPEQYQDCPRSIEFVVSTTKHLPSLLEGATVLSDSQCSATLRTFDQAVWQASRQLLMPNSNSTSDDNNVDDRVNATTTESLVVDDPDTDLRRLSLCYYIVPEEWQGGGLRFADGTTVEARRDRLVLWKSAETALQKLPWRATDEQPVGSCLELHLVEKPSGDSS